MMYRLLAILIAVFLLLSGQVSAQKTVELGVYAEWRGDNCKYKSARPFFIIRDLYDLERFWQQADAAEGMPAIDFDKYMLLVWAPGPTMFDYRPAMIERFIYQDGFYIVVMDIQRKDSGGFWRSPFVATMLLNKTGDIFIMRKEVEGTRETWKPLYTIWDMSGERTRPFEVVKIETPPEKAKFIEHVPSTKTGAETSQVAATSATSASVAVTTPTTQTGEPVGSVAQAVTGSTPATTRTAAAQPAKPGDGFEDIFGSPTAVKSEAKPAAGTQSAGPTLTPPVKQPGQPSLPAFAEDPLFGSEFDIEF